MTQLIKTSLSAANTDLLDKQLKTALPADVCYGILADKNGLFLVMSDDATQGQINQALAIAQAHNPDDTTPEQDKEATAKQEQTAFVEGFDAINAALDAIITKNPNAEVTALANVVQQLAKLVYYATSAK